MILILEIILRKLIPQSSRDVSKDTGIGGPGTSDLGLGDIGKGFGKI